MNGALQVYVLVSSVAPGDPWRAGIAVQFTDPAGRLKVWNTYVMDPSRDVAILDCITAVEQDIRRTALFSTQEWQQFQTTVWALRQNHKQNEWDVLKGYWGAVTAITNGILFTSDSGLFGSGNDPLAELLNMSNPVPQGLSLTPSFPPGGMPSAGAGAGTQASTNPTPGQMPGQVANGVDPAEDEVDLLDLVSI